MSWKTGPMRGILYADEMGTAFFDFCKESCGNGLWGYNGGLEGGERVAAADCTF